MKNSFASTALSLASALSLFALSACGGVSNGVPSGASALQSAATVSHAAGTVNLGGEYAGPFNDNAYGKGKGSAFYAQQGVSTGGVLSINYGSTTVTASVSQVVSGSTVTGTTVGGTGSLYCSFSTKATWDAKKHALKGSYMAVYGCSGEQGTFTLKQQCYFKGQGSEDIRPDGGGHPC